jgi:hypothetical protein
MAKAARGLPEDFSLDLPDEKPVVLGDFLDEEPVPILPARKPQRVHSPAPAERVGAPVQFRPEIVRDPEPAFIDSAAARPPARTAKQPSVIRYQLNLTPKSKTMLEELVEHVRTYSPQGDARTSEVFQGIMTLLHNAMDELELAELPRRGAWGSVTAKNFPSALSVAFEKAIVEAARKRETPPAHY